MPTGIEVWNTKYDGRYAPRPELFRLVQLLQARKPALRAFYGQDFHWKKQFRGLFNVLPCPLNKSAILECFRSGDFCAVMGSLELPSHGRLPQPLLLQFAGIYRRSSRLRKLAIRAKNLAEGLGLTIPAAVKAELRKLF